MPGKHAGSGEVHCPVCGLQTSLLFPISMNPGRQANSQVAPRLLLHGYKATPFGGGTNRGKQYPICLTSRFRGLEMLTRKR